MVLAFKEKVPPFDCAPPGMGPPTPAGLGIRCAAWRGPRQWEGAKDRLRPNARALSSHEDWQSCVRCPTRLRRHFLDKARRAVTPHQLRYDRLQSFLGRLPRRAECRWPKVKNSPKNEAPAGGGRGVPWG